GFKGQRKYLYLFGTVALFVLLIAAVNYVNLVTAQAARRAREVGVRKTLGAGRTQLARQILGESILFRLVALAFALGLSALTLPAFNRLFDKELTFSIGEYGIALPLLCTFVLLVGITAGMYPAFVLSRIRPTEVLRGAGTKTPVSRGRLLRQGLVVLQFTISIVLIIGTAVIYRQLAFIQNKDLGFDGNQVVVVDLPPTRTPQLRETLKQHVLSNPGILRASLANGFPGRFFVTLGRKVEDVSSQARTEKENIQFNPAVVDFDFVELLDLRLLAGRAFSETFSSDLAHAYILNES